MGAARVHGNRGAGWSLLVAWLGGAGLGCHTTPPPAVVIGHTHVLEKVSPRAVSRDVEFTVLGNVYDTLVSLGPELELTPGLAQSWANLDERTMELRLRAGVRFHDGRELSAENAVRALEEARSRSRGSLVNLDDVVAIEAAGPLTLRLRTRKAAPTLGLRLCLIFVALPARGEDGADVGTGPFRIVGFEPNGFVDLEAVEGGWHDRPAFRRARYLQLADDRALGEALRSGAVHLARVNAGAGGAEGTFPPNLRVVRRAGLSEDLLTFSGPLAPPNPFADVRVRRAVALAIDRAELAAAVGSGSAPLDQVIPRVVHGHHATLPPALFDVQEARRLLDAAGWSQGFGVRLETTTPEARLLREAVAVALGRIGIVIAPANEPAADAPVVTVTRITFPPDAAWTYSLLLRHLAAGQGSPELHDLVDRAELEVDPQARLKVLETVAETIRREVVAVPLLQHADEYVMAAEIGFRPRLDRSILVADLEWHGRR